MTTLQKLNMTQEAYELMVLGCYMRWCESITGSIKQYQTVLANKGINAYYLMELAKCEAEFHQLTDRYINTPTVTIKDMQICYNDCTYRLFNLRPTALLESLKIKGKTQGIPVYNLISAN